MDKLIELLTEHVLNYASLPTIIGDTDRVIISDEFGDYWVEGFCVVSLGRIDTEADETNWYDHRLKFTIDKVDAKDADGEWHKLPRSQVRELQMELNKSI